MKKASSKPDEPTPRLRSIFAGWGLIAESGAWADGRAPGSLRVGVFGCWSAPGEELELVVLEVEVAVAGHAGLHLAAATRGGHRA